MLHMCIGGVQCLFTCTEPGVCQPQQGRPSSLACSALSDMASPAGRAALESCSPESSSPRLMQALSHAVHESSSLCLMQALSHAARASSSLCLMQALKYEAPSHAGRKSCSP